MDLAVVVPVGEVGEVQEVAVSVVVALEGLGEGDQEEVGLLMPSTTTIQAAAEQMRIRYLV